MSSSHEGYPSWSATYLPFGQEHNPQPTTNHYKFTGKERDPESGCDYLGARHYCSSFGRFTSVDPILLRANRLPDPQRLNLYAYVRNNPLQFVDPDGRDLAQAWKNVKTFFQSAFIRVSGGVGAEAKVRLGPQKGRVGASFTVNVETSKDSIVTVSRSAEIGITGGPRSGPKIGLGYSGEQTVLTVDNEKNVTGVEKPKEDVVVGLSQGDSTGSADSERIGIGVQGGVGLVLGAEAGVTVEGARALKDAVKEVKDSVTNPPPPPKPTPPPPPKCVERDKGCSGA